MSCIEGKGGMKDIHCSAQNAALFVDLLWNIFCLNAVWFLVWFTAQHSSANILEYIFSRLDQRRIHSIMCPWSFILEELVITIGKKDWYISHQGHLSDVVQIWEWWKGAKKSLISLDRKHFFLLFSSLTTNYASFSF